MKKNKIAISIFAAVCVLSTIVGYNLIKQNNHKYDQLAVMLKQDDGTYIRSNMSAFGNDDYEFDHAVCNNGTTVTANSNEGVNLKLLGTDKCTVYLKKLASIVVDNIKAEVKITKPDFTQITPKKYIVGNNFIVNHTYDGYTNVVHETTYVKFTYNETTKQWEAPINVPYTIDAILVFSVSENKENMAICYDSGLPGNDEVAVSFYKNDISYYYETNEGTTCMRLGNLTTDDRLKIEYHASSEYEEYSDFRKFNFYLVDDYTIKDTDSGVYTVEDNYGTSYYFRGDVDNNYVKFGNFYWRIVRLNGDGSLRIAYDGTTPHLNGDISTDRALSTSKFNNNYNNNAYVGYMYGNRNGTTYDAIHANTYSSTIKTYLDSWYETNIKNKGLAGYVSDTLFCNDRSVTSGTGIGTTVTHYGAYTRATTDAEPILTCPQKNDAFTVDDTENGNGALKYPIGLLTADEYRLAGGKFQTSLNSSYINKPGVGWWLGSPGYHNSNRAGNAYNFIIIDDGRMGYYYVGYSHAVVPVINLTAKYTQQLKGSGTMDDPYTLE